MASSGIRTATVPLVSPRSQLSEGCAFRTRVRAPGQNAAMRARASAGISRARPSTVRTLGTRTGGGMSRPRPLAASTAATAFGVERVGADAVDRVGRQDDDLTLTHGPGGRLDPGGEAVGGGAVDDDRTAAGAGRRGRGRASGTRSGTCSGTWCRRRRRRRRPDPACSWAPLGGGTGTPVRVAGPGRRPSPGAGRRGRAGRGRRPTACDAAGPAAATHPGCRRAP